MGEAIAFWVLAAVTVLAALGVVMLRNLFHCALCLGLVLICVAGIFVLNGAEFLAGVQVLIYVGATLVIILFAIMLSEDIAGRRIQLASYNQFIGLVAAVVFLVTVAFLALTTNNFPSHTSTVKDPTIAVLANVKTNISAFGTLLLTKFIVPFEFASVFLLIALIGAIIIARTAE
ncbi:MAG: NADH-quinone oxidoreductase subunit J [Armatimonadota bacterium]